MTTNLNCLLQTSLSLRLSFGKPYNPPSKSGILRMKGEVINIDPGERVTNRARSRPTRAPGPPHCQVLALYSCSSTLFPIRFSFLGSTAPLARNHRGRGEESQDLKPKPNVEYLTYVIDSLFFFFFFFLAMPLGMRDLSSPNGDQTWALGSETADS